MANDRLAKLERALEELIKRRFQFAEALGARTSQRGDTERSIEELLKTHEAIKVLEELMAQEKRL